MLTFYEYINRWILCCNITVNTKWMEMTVHIPEAWALSKLKLLVGPNILRISFRLLFHLFLPHWIGPNCLTEIRKEGKTCRLASSNCPACTGSHLPSRIPGQKTSGQKTWVLSLVLIPCSHPLSLIFGSKLMGSFPPCSLQPAMPTTALLAQRSTSIPLLMTPRGRGDCSGTGVRNRKVLTQNKNQWICKTVWFLTELLLATATAFARDLWQNFAVVKYPLALIFCEHLELVWQRVPSITWKIRSHFSLIFKPN